ncbi:MAG: acylphosphatase [Spirochaetes bacterium]|nr:acylphosphatase [Spirochaetota bacterium]
MDTQVHLVVSGMVQGVGYRMFVQRLARHLKLCGWVRNLPTGQVEVCAEGSRCLIESLIQTMRTGNRYASVRSIQINWQDYTGKYTGFDITF